MRAFRRLLLAPGPGHAPCGRAAARAGSTPHRCRGLLPDEQVCDGRSHRRAPAGRPGAGNRRCDLRRERLHQARAPARGRDSRPRRELGQQDAHEVGRDRKGRTPSEGGRIGATARGHHDVARRLRRRAGPERRRPARGGRRGAARVGLPAPDLQPRAGARGRRDRARRRRPGRDLRRPGGHDHGAQHVRRRPRALGRAGPWTGWWGRTRRTTRRSSS